MNINDVYYIVKIIIYTGSIPVIMLPLILKLIDYLGNRFLEK